MPAVPFSNKRHVFQIAREELAGVDDRPDVRVGGRWIKVQAHGATPRDALERLENRLRELGYHTSIERTTVKATKQQQWPEVPDGV